MPARYVISVGNEEITFEGPEGLTDEQITKLADTHLKTAKPGQTFRTSVYGGQVEHPPVEEPEGPEESWIDWANKPRKWEHGAGFMQGLANVGDHAANLLESGYNNTFGRVFGESTSADTPAFSNVAAELGEGSEAGKLAGEVVGTAVLTRGMGGPIAQGMASGAIMSDADNVGDFAKDVVVAGAGGKAGDMVGKTIARAVSPAVDRAAQHLSSRGVKMSPGQYLPGFKKTEDKLRSWPFVGSKIDDARRESFEGFNRSTVEQILEPVGIKLPAGVKTGHQAIKFAGDRLSERYEALIPKLAIRIDQEALDEADALGAWLKDQGVSEDGLQKLKDLVSNGVFSRFTGPDATGIQYRAADRFLGETIARYGKSTDPDHQAMTEALKELQGTLSGMLQRSNPAHAKTLEAINEGWSRLVPAETAAAGAKRGIFSAEQYRTAIRQNNKQVRKRGMARGEAKGQEWAEAGSEVLPGAYPDSGTSGREALSIADPRFYGGMLLSPLYGETPQNLMRTITLSPRPGFAEPVANFITALPSAQAGSLSLMGALSGQPVP